MAQEQSASAVAGAALLTHEAKALLKPDYSGPAFVRVLVEHQRYLDAVRFLAQFMAPRQAVWWGCLCVRHTLGDSELERDALHAAARMVRAPNEDNKKACRPFRKSATPGTPAGCLAMAAVQADAHAGRSVSAAVLLAAARAPSLKQCLLDFTAIGLDLCAGQLDWTIDKG